MRHKENLLQVVLHNEKCDFDKTMSANTPIKIKLTVWSKVWKDGTTKQSKVTAYSHFAIWGLNLSACQLGGQARKKDDDSPQF